jgi:hypothetical protein
MLAIPKDLEHMTAEWLTRCLHDAGALAHGTVAARRVTRFGEGVGLLGQLARVELTYSADASGELPRSLVIKLASQLPQNLALCEAIRLYWREHNFYAHSQRETPLHTPHMYVSELVGLTEQLLILEDIRDASAGDQIVGATAAQVRCAARHVAKHHARFWRQPRAGAQSWLPCLSDAAIAPIVQHLTALGTPKLLAQLPECFDDTTRAVASELCEKLVPLSAALCSGITTFCHGDYRIDNLLFGGPLELTVVDWQLCYEACPPYDVAYLMTQSVEPPLRRQIEAEVLHGYHAALEANGVRQYSEAQLFQDYRRATTYCLCYPLIAAGTLDLSNERGRALGHMMLSRALTAAADLDCLGVLRELHV